jgi:enamine deaminase RidA (YjgF/YER057c/UK114 family)
VEVIAHIGVDKRVLSSDVAQNNGRCWAAGVRAGRYVYLSGRRAYGVAGALSVNSPRLTDETYGIYSEFDRLLHEAGVAWRDLVRVRQFVTEPGADFNHVRNGRRIYVPTGAFTSTSLCCAADDPSGNVAGPWTIAADLEATTGTKISVSTNALVETPATAHAVKIGNLVHLQAEISTDDKDEIVFPRDIEGQARHVLQKMDLLLAAADCAWSDVVTSRIFCREREHLKSVRKIERHWAGSSVYARSDAICRFFHPDALVEIELTVARS